MGATNIRRPYQGNIYLVKPYDPKYLFLVGIIHALRDVSPLAARNKLVQTSFVLKSIIIERGADYGLDKAVDSAEQLVVVIDTFVKENFDFNNESWRALLNPLLDGFESTLAGDINSHHIYLLEKKRGYSVDTLLFSIHECLPREDHPFLPEFARDNMQEAGACLAFHRFTACGYHMSRAVEDVARRYYEVVTGRESALPPDSDGTPRYRGLGAIAKELDDYLGTRGSRSCGLLPLVIPTLQQFCRIYRNPLSHADRNLQTLSSSEAEIAFGHAISGISTMLEDVRTGGLHFSEVTKIPTLFPSAN